MLFIMGLIAGTTMISGGKDNSFGGILLIGSFFALFFIDKLTEKITEIFSPYMILLGIGTILSLVILTKAMYLYNLSKKWIFDRIMGFSLMWSSIMGSLFFITFFGKKDCLGLLTLITAPLLAPTTLESSSVIAIIIYWIISLGALVIDIFFIVFTVPIVAVIITGLVPEK